MNRSEKLKVGHKNTTELHKIRISPATEPIPENRTPSSRGSGLRDAEGVMTADLQKELKRWRKEFEANHPRNEGRSGRVGNTYASWGNYKEIRQFTEPTVQMGAVDWLHEKSGVPTRQISRILAGESKWTNLKMADALLTAIGSYHKLAYEIRVVPNPQWTNEKYVEYLRERGCA